MKFSYQFRTTAEKNALYVYNLLVENFSKSFFVGGTVRDMLLHKKVTDFDIVTNATPEQVVATLRLHNIATDKKHARYGVVVATHNGTVVEIATLRKDTQTDSRYPDVAFVSNPKIDSKRRDFTVNALYFSPKQGMIHDYQNGLKDMKNKRLHFIGDPNKRIAEDPLRIVRAYRFMLQLQFKFEGRTEHTLQQSAHLLKTISSSRINTEIAKLSKPLQKKLRTIINKST